MPKATELVGGPSGVLASENTVLLATPLRS